jgi:glucose/arabinose dehydrogenase
MHQLLSSTAGRVQGRRFSCAAAVLACLCGAAPAFAQQLVGPGATDLDMKDYAKGLGSPTDIVILPDGRGVITEQGGDVLLYTNGVKSTAGHITTNTNNGEQGLLGVVADPKFATNHYLYFYADVGGTDDRHQILRYTLDNGQIGTKTVILGTGGPTPGIFGPANHNGGSMVIYNNELYIGVGDTGNNATPPVNELGTCLNSPNGKILRINLDGSIPNDNPLVNTPMVTGCNAFNQPLTMMAPDKRIFAWGFRNPFRFWIDPSGAQAGMLWVGDVGEVTREKVAVGKGAQHFGWPFHEGTVTYKPGATTGNPANCDCSQAACQCTESYQPAGACMGITPATACVPTAYDYGHTDGNNCIIGGLVIDGCGWPAAWKSRYVFGDNGSGNVWTLEVNDTRTGVKPGGVTLIAKVAGPAAFRMGLDNALYIVNNGGKSVERVTPKNQAADCAIPDGGLPPPSDAGGGAGGSNGAGGANGGTGGGNNGAGGSNSGAGGANSGTGTGTAGDLGAGGTSSGTTTGGVGNGGDVGASPSADDSGGCGCRSAAGSPMRFGAGLVLAGTVAVSLLRRRRGNRRKRA